MRCSLSLVIAIGLFAACSRQHPAPAAPALPQTSGSIAVVGLVEPVRIVRDRSGVPHIYARNTGDLFFAQGFTQAQDRLFQMDLWRRASLGRLSEVLGANFIDRDAMTRRIQYHGNRDAEWASYGADAKAIVESFVRGVNAWVSIAREQPQEDFTRAGWPPAYWSADDLLSRTDAFVDERDRVLDEIGRRSLPDAVRDAIRLIGTPPFLVGPQPPDTLIAVRAVPRAAATPGSVVAADARGTLTVPSPRYLVHLVAPGWNVAGATAPWLPGVAMGHNDRLAWAFAPLDTEPPRIVIQDANQIVVSPTEYIRVKGRATMVSFTRETTADGLVVASDREHGRAFVLQWRGFQPGGAAELGATGIDRARNADELRDALARWRARRFVYADVEGKSGSAEAPPGPRGPTLPTGVGRVLEDRAIADRALFAHVLGVRARERFDVGPLPRPRDDAQLQIALDPNAWDRSTTINAPGQSGVVGSPHYADAAARWSSGEPVTLPFSEGAVEGNAEATLTLTPRR